VVSKKKRKIPYLIEACPNGHDEGRNKIAFLGVSGEKRGRAQEYDLKKKSKLTKEPTPKAKERDHTDCNRGPESKRGHKEAAGGDTAATDEDKQMDVTPSSGLCGKEDSERKGKTWRKRGRQLG